MILIFLPALIALVVITAIWLSTLTHRKPKPMLEQIADAQKVTSSERFYATLLARTR